MLDPAASTLTAPSPRWQGPSHREGMQSRGVWRGADLKLQEEQVVAPNLWLSAAREPTASRDLRTSPGSTFQNFTARVFQICRKCNLQEDVG